VVAEAEEASEDVVVVRAGVVAEAEEASEDVVVVRAGVVAEAEEASEDVVVVRAGVVAPRGGRNGFGSLVADPGAVARSRSGWPRWCAKRREHRH